MIMDTKAYMKQTITEMLKKVLIDMGVSHPDPEVKISDAPQHGDYTTNIAMHLTKILNKNPMIIAEEIVQALKEHFGVEKEGIDKIEAVHPGFVNFSLTDSALIRYLIEKQRRPVRPTSTVMVEFAHPNTHKAFHIGHLRNIITGECIVRLLEANGNKVIRANYQGDVGLHIAKALYGILHNTKSDIHTLENADIKEKIQFLSETYSAGNKAYEEDETAKKEINELNKKIYAKDPSIYPLYEKTRSWSLQYFDGIYKRVGSHFDRFYFESETYDLGKTLVMDNVAKGIFEKSDGAVIFPGEKYALPAGRQGLHNRVFITSEGNPTYEGKDIGLAKLQFDEYHPDRIIHCVASEQIEYFRVIFEAISRVFPDTKGKEHHLVYGWVRLKSGKMSSRSGNVVLGEWLLDEVKKSMQEILTKGERGYDRKEQNDIAEKASVAAVKYAFLKVSTPQEIAFDINESININGDSGPYLLYAYARCKSVMEKSHQRSSVSFQTADAQNNIKLNQEEHNLARLLLYFPETIESAAINFAPNFLCTYLFNLAQTFNLLYAKHPILKNNLRIMLIEKTALTLREGLRLLGIDTIERM